MRCFQGRLFTVDGMIEDEAPLKKEIYEQVRYYATTSLSLIHISEPTRRTPISYAVFCLKKKKHHKKKKTRHLTNNKS